MPISELLLLLLTGLVMLMLLACTIVPVLPGPTLILLVATGYCLLHGFGERGDQLLITMTLLAITSSVAKLWFAKSAVIQGGASRQSILLGLTLAFMGFFILPVLSLIHI